MRLRNGNERNKLIARLPEREDVEETRGKNDEREENFRRNDHRDNGDRRRGWWWWWWPEAGREAGERNEVALTIKSGSL